MVCEFVNNEVVSDVLLVIANCWASEKLITEEQYQTIAQYIYKTCPLNKKSA